MHKIEIQVKALIDEIKNTNEYSAFNELRGIVQEEPELYNKINEYRRRCFEIQCQANYGAYAEHEELSRIEKEYEHILSKPVVRDFINSEIKLSRLLSKTYNLIAEGIDFDLDFLID